MISTTIKLEYMELILAGSKKIEYKGNSDFWRDRLVKHLDPNCYRDWEGCLSFTTPGLVINFLCGRIHYKYHVEKIQLICKQMDIAGEVHDSYFEIHLGNRLDGSR